MTTTNAKRVAEVSLKELARVALAVRDERDALRARCERLEAALIAVRKLFDDGLVVRDTSHDHEPDWAIRSGMPTTMAVQLMVAALAGEGK